ncbi:Phosphatidylcholine-hydrolyzing phospholipase C [Moritella viscosa]|nr:Phosphatidylcholine-hydrolyzing phospholipase C [Moritella viscosa]SHO02033.1 Phosphatidylcholine-hydrolyzing phospholipase C [Moritella viscosa]SHO20647.1 Phosphatidylcholine-hydrolyzing phospholipase C [Moritella viscosa]
MDMKKISHKVSCILACVMASTFTSGAQAFNSEEHKNIVDNAIAQLKIPETIKLPTTVSLKSRTDSYTKELRAAKQLAAGFDGNDENDYDSYKYNVQDNCYYSGFGQSHYNNTIYIPTGSQLPTKLLTLNTNMGSQSDEFTLGELAAIYGDYRRTTSCDADGQCFLSNDIKENIVFKHGSHPAYCPQPVKNTTYLHHVGSGVVPPFGALGNLSSNTAGDGELEEAAWWGDEMMRIANVNDWHFSDAAVAWYIGLHRQALYYADKARTEPKYWNVALHHEANALHSLTDLFSFGHVVTSREESSFNMIKSAGLKEKGTYLWMEAIMKQAGATRDRDGILSFALADFPPIMRIATAPRNDFMPSYRGIWMMWAKDEQGFHDRFNESGALVRNLNGDRFQIYGDSHLKELTDQSKEIIIMATKTSIQSLLDAYQVLEHGSDITEVGAVGSQFFNALNYLPAFVEKDGDSYFTGTWTSYADVINTMVGSGKVLNDKANCTLSTVSGKIRGRLKTRSKACTVF